MPSLRDWRGFWSFQGFRVGSGSVRNADRMNQRYECLMAFSGACTPQNRTIGVNLVCRLIVPNPVGWVERCWEVRCGYAKNAWKPISWASIQAQSETQLYTISVSGTAKALGFTPFFFCVNIYGEPSVFSCFSVFWWHPFNPTYDANDHLFFIIYIKKGFSSKNLIFFYLLIIKTF